MDKYDGMNRVEATVAPSDTVKRKSLPEHKEKKAKGGFLRLLILQTVIAGLICGALFGVKLISGGRYAAAARTVKEAVCFDAYEYVAEQIKDKDE